MFGDVLELFFGLDGEMGVVGNWGVTGHKNKSVTKTNGRESESSHGETSLVYFSAVGVTL